MFKKLILITDTPRGLSVDVDSHSSRPASAPSGHRHPSLRPDFNQEWEDEKTIQAVANTWRNIGLDVEILSLGKGFLADFARIVAEDPQHTIVHSLAEGWGSIAREAWIPSLCELSGLAWIGSSAAAFAICMDKDLTLQVASSLGVSVPRGLVIRSASDYHAHMDATDAAPHFIKPNAEGSGLGIDDDSRRSKGNPLNDALLADRLTRFPEGLRIEQIVEGSDYTTAIVGRDTLLPAARISVPGDIYGAEHKRKDSMTEEVDFPDLPSETRSKLADGTRRIWNRLGLADFARVDWKLSDTGEPFLLEVNPLAGLSPFYSVLPLMWQVTGRSYQELLQVLLESAADKHSSRSLVYGRQVLQQSSS